MGVQVNTYGMFNGFSLSLLERQTKMKVNQFAGISALVSAKATEGADGGGAAVADAPTPISPAAEKAEAEAKEKAKAEAEAAKKTPFSFGGLSLTGAAFESLEAAWKSAQGRIKAAVARRAEIIGQMDIDSADRKKSKVKLGTNVTLDTVIVSGVNTVAAVAKELLDNKLISPGDASVMVSYVTVWTAINTATKAGRL